MAEETPRPGSAARSPFGPPVGWRRSIRLRGFDYSQPGAYFVTICTHGRARVLSEIVEGEVYFSALGEIVDACWRDIPSHFSHVALDPHVVMPDHIHGILRFRGRGTPWRDRDRDAPSGDGGDTPSGEGRGTPWRAPTEAFGRPVIGSLPIVIRAFKSSVTRIARRHGFEGRFWQRGYYERVVRNDDELALIRQYIQGNPDAWDLLDDDP